MKNNMLYTIIMIPIGIILVCISILAGVICSIIEYIKASKIFTLTHK